MSNIYLNEFDRFMMHQLKPLAYLRYGDDWLCFTQGKGELLLLRAQAIEKLACLSFRVNKKVDSVAKAHQGVSYLGVNIWPSGKRLQPSVRTRISERIATANAPSYFALMGKHEKAKYTKDMQWELSKRTLL